MWGIINDVGDVLEKKSLRDGVSLITMIFLYTKNETQMKH